MTSRANWEARIKEGGGEFCTKSNPCKNTETKAKAVDYVPGDKDSTTEKLREHTRKLKEFIDSPPN